MFLTDRDYATTLQMRRSAGGQSTTPLLRRADPVAAAACSCPLHGHVGAPAEDDLPLPPPPSPSPHLHTSTYPRFSSFRPRVEHIYEVPKFLDGGHELDDEDTGPVNCSSPLYSELDTKAFGTVGRRTPSTRGACRQPFNANNNNNSK